MNAQTTHSLILISIILVYMYATHSVLNPTISNKELVKRLLWFPILLTTAPFYFSYLGLKRLFHYITRI